MEAWTVRRKYWKPHEAEINAFMTCEMHGSSRNYTAHSKSYKNATCLSLGISHLHCNYVPCTSQRHPSYAQMASVFHLTKQLGAMMGL
jgi:hypothetical protein